MCGVDRIIFAFRNICGIRLSHFEVGMAFAFGFEVLFFGFPFGYEVVQPGVGTGCIVRRIGEVDDVIVRAYGEALDVAQLGQLLAKTFAEVGTASIVVDKFNAETRHRSLDNAFAKQRSRIASLQILKREEAFLLDAVG